MRINYQGKRELLKIRTVIFSFYLFITPSVAFAYIDPGSTFLILQGFIAVAGGVIVFIKNPIKKIKSIFFKLKLKRNA